MDTAPTTWLEAKNTNKKKKQAGGPRGGSRRGKPKRDGVPDSDEEMMDRFAKSAVRQPKRFRKRLIELERQSRPPHQQLQLQQQEKLQQKQQTQLFPPLRVCSVEVDDREWWEQEGNDNPYGARLWPSALAISELLVGGVGTGNNRFVEKYNILEIGCGAGLVSIVAAECGARVIASDVSPIAIKLCRAGWKETQNLRTKEELAAEKKRRQREKLQRFRQMNAMRADTTESKEGSTSDAKENLPSKDSQEKTPIVSKPGTLDTLNLDLFSETPLPVDSSEKPQMVIAATMMYEPDLAVVLAKRAMEACRCGAWVIIGDDDTGERDGGRGLFVSELDRLEKEEGVSFPRTWTSSRVQSKALQWNEKQVRILHLNAPLDVQECLQNKF